MSDMKLAYQSCTVQDYKRKAKHADRNNRSCERKLLGYSLVSVNTSIQSMCQQVNWAKQWPDAIKSCKRRH